MVVDIPKLPLKRVISDGREVWVEQRPQVCPKCGVPWRLDGGSFRVDWSPCDCYPGAQMAPCGHRMYTCRSCGEEIRVGHLA
jgi:hypothetical protein